MGVNLSKPHTSELVIDRIQFEQNDKNGKLCTIVCSCSLDTLFIDNNLPKQWSIKMKFVPLGSPLKSTQMHFKTISFGGGTKML